MLGRQLELVKKASGSAFHDLEMLIRASIFRKEAILDDMTDFKRCRSELLSTLDIVVVLHNTATCSNKLIEKKLNAYLSEFHGFYRDFKSRYSAMT